MAELQTEAGLMRAIMLALSERGHYVERANVGLFYTKDGRPITTGLPKGRSDLSGFRVEDCRAFFIEVKLNGRATPEQKSFIAAMQQRGALAGFARSVEDALRILSVGNDAAIL